MDMRRRNDFVEIFCKKYFCIYQGNVSLLYFVTLILLSVSPSGNSISSFPDSDVDSLKFSGSVDEECSDSTSTPPLSWNTYTRSALLNVGPRKDDLFCDPLETLVTLSQDGLSYQQLTF